ncbi:hypothetical protein SAMN05660657_03702 [Geodermatophilus amargosae]|uniref:Uncharacterized protein n=1 Tax=Geodermatophilus amargosae TaxID=1296565 RepID=A0A1I7BNC6_9ACTN|nr:hypothetical protein SAMN05660657_03702 [Geodermatophilus amargosae]
MPHAKTVRLTQDGNSARPYRTKVATITRSASAQTTLTHACRPGSFAGPHTE